MMVLTVLLARAQQSVPPQPSIWLTVWAWFPALIGLAFYVILAFCIYRAAKYFGTAGRDQKLLRIEVTKLAEEVHLLRQGLEQDKDTDSAVQ